MLQKKTPHLARRYQLLTGALLATLLPGIFIFSGGHEHALAHRFLLSSTSIFSLWLVTFTMMDFSPLWLRPAPHIHLKIIRDVSFTTLVAVSVYLGIGLIDTSGLLLSQVQGELMYDFKAWFYLVLRIALLNGLIILIKYFFDFSTEKARIQAEVELLKHENLMAMHETLKQQMNPHFLFNSLNTLKSLIKHEPKTSLHFIDELASVYRYMLVHSGRNEVTLKEEIAFVNSYLSLLKIRYGDSLVFQLSIPGEYLSTRIPPNTLQVLIENVVKHNKLTRQCPLRINIYATAEHVVVENNLRYKEPAGFSSNVGLANINDRFMILKGNRIMVEKNDEYFTVKLPLLN